MISFLKQLFSRSSDFENSAFLKDLLEYTPSNLEHYNQAFTHSSVSTSKKQSNERLEFLGDCILDCIVAEYLYLKYPNYSEGRLSSVKAVIVNRKHLNKLAQRINIDKVLKSDLKTAVSETIFGNALEALIGAVYLDKGYSVTKSFVNNLLNKYVNIKRLEKFYRNYKGELVEWAQKNKKTIEYKLLSDDFVGIEKIFKVQLLIDGIVVTEAEHTSKKIAEKKVAEQAFNTTFVVTGSNN